MKYTNSFIKQVCSLYAQYPTGTVAQMCNLKRDQVIYIVKKYSSIRSLQESKNLSKIKVNDYYFSSINSEHKAYWLGFLYADGNISKRKNEITLTLKKSDYKHLQKFIDDLEIQKSVSFYTIKSGKFKGKESCSVGFSSNIMKQDLILYGCTPNKSLTLEFPNKAIFKDPDLIRHFIRGYFDGDGSVFTSKEKHWRYGTITNVIH